MEVQNLVNQYNSFKATITIGHTVQGNKDSKSTEYLVCGSAAVFQIRSLSYYTSGYSCTISSMIISIRFAKRNSYFKGNCTLYLNSCDLNIKNKVFKEDDSWRIISTNITHKFDISADFQFELCVTRINHSPHLLKDSEFTDFELKSNDGSVRVHRCLVALYSPVLKKMLQGSWKETNEGCLDLPDTSIETLEDFKQFIYIEKLPDNCEHLMNLLLLAKHYMMSYLEELCVKKLGCTVNVNSVIKLLEFSFAHQFPDLTSDLLIFIKKTEMDITKIVAKYKESCKQIEVTSDEEIE